MAKFVDSDVAFAVGLHISLSIKINLHGVYFGESIKRSYFVAMMDSVFCLDTRVMYRVNKKRSASR